MLIDIIIDYLLILYVFAYKISGRFFSCPNRRDNIRC